MLEERRKEMKIERNGGGCVRHSICRAIWCQRQQQWPFVWSAGGDHRVASPLFSANIRNPFLHVLFRLSLFVIFISSLLLFQSSSYSFLCRRLSSSSVSNLYVLSSPLLPPSKSHPPSPLMSCVARKQIGRVYFGSFS